MYVELHGECWQLAYSIPVVGIIPSPLSPKNRQDGGAPGKILSLSLARGGGGGGGGCIGPSMCHVSGDGQSHSLFLGPGGGS